MTRTLLPEDRGSFPDRARPRPTTLRDSRQCCWGARGRRGGVRADPARHHPTWGRTATGMLGSAVDAEQAVQEALHAGGLDRKDVPPLQLP